MAKKDTLQKLSSLTERQYEVLRLVCSGFTYKEIGEALYIAESTVKAHMGNIYQKLGLDLLPPTQRTKTLFEQYCPVLKDVSSKPLETQEELEPVPESVEKMVEEDEKALAIWQPKPLVSVKPIELKPLAPRPRRLRGLVLGMILGAVLVSVPVFLLGRNLTSDEAPAAISGAEPIVEYVEVTVEVPIEVPVERTVVVTTTPGPEQPTQTAVIQEVVVVVTTTPEPTPTATPAPTEPVNTPPDTVLEVGEWWKHEGVWLRVSEVEYENPDYIKIRVELWNKTGNDLIFDWSPTGNFSLVDNTEHRYTPDHYFKSGVDSEMIEAGDLVQLHHTFYGDPAAKYDDGHFFDALVKDLVFTIMDLSRVPFAQWHFSVPK